MDETATRRKKIDPKLYEVGWEQVPESEIIIRYLELHPKMTYRQLEQINTNPEVCFWQGQRGITLRR